MPCYREAVPILKRTVDSILAQTLRDIELIAVLDDPQNKEALSLLQDFAAADNRVRVLVNEKNMGVWPSYNRGIRAARGRLLAIQDADDVSDPRRLEVAAAYLAAHPEVDVVGMGLIYVDADTGATLMTRRYPPDAGSVIKRYCPVAHATTLRRRELHERLGYYDESQELRCAADYDLWMRFYAGGAVIRNIPDALYTYYQSTSNIKTLNTKRILRQTIRIKLRHARTLRFGAGDYLYLACEAALLLLPEPAIRRLFYAVMRRRQPREAGNAS
ncbi:MAG: glycosyltransferase [Candidatus Sumerlaeaceae bacterium]|nr:glycosyltransferase [Candidatus Sumerlaeaceae bacterium]